MQLFFNKDTSKSFTLNREESKHIIKVLRKKEGDILSFTNGEGILSITEITNASLNKTQVKVIERTNKQKNRNYYLHIAIALTKNINRFEWFLEKATEIGIDEITPIICERSERKSLNYNRSNRILISAIKQSIKYHLPKLNKTFKFKDFIKNISHKKKYIANCQEKHRLLKSEDIGKDILIIIGPEGDFTDIEINLAIKEEFKSLNLHKDRLRTETAGICAVNTINIIS